MHEGQHLNKAHRLEEFDKHETWKDWRNQEVSLMVDTMSQDGLRKRLAQE